VRQHCPKTPIVLVNTSNPDWNSTDEHKSTFDFEDGMRLAKQITADTYVECPYKLKECTFSEEDTDAVFVAAVRAAVKAKQLQAALANRPQSALDQRPQSALDKLKSFFAGRHVKLFVTFLSESLS
jgi:hypothetical protein